MFEMIIIWAVAIAIPVVAFFNIKKNENDRRKCAVAHENWANANRADFEKIGVYI